jgi:serine/threonine-protein kinase
LSFRKHIEKLGIVQTDLSSQFAFKKYIGKGAFSEVYLAQHVETSTTVAAKVMKKPVGYPDVNVDARVWDEFSKEVRVLARAQGHENIMKLHGAYLFRTNDEASNGPGGCTLTMITELLDISLLDLVKKNGKLPESSTKGVAESLLRALAHLNSVGFAHRDIKVSNVMLRSLERGGIVLVDYGFGREDIGPEVFKSVVGTVGYLAPELFLENTAVDLRCADIFSVGIVTLTCLIGRSVFQGKSKDGVATDRCKYYENQRCEINMDGPSMALTPLGLESLKAMLEIDPDNRPIAAEALRSEWYDLTLEECVPGDIPEPKQRELAFLTAPLFRRSTIGDAAPAEKPVARRPSLPSEGSGGSQQAPLKPTPPPNAPTALLAANLAV